MPATVVIVHNDIVFVDQLVTALTSTGHDVVAFTDPLVAWNALAHTCLTEVLITDVRFPPGRSNGVALAHMVHSNHPRIQVIFTAQPEFAKACEDTGVFLPLPVSVSEVARTVELLLQDCDLLYR